MELSDFQDLFEVVVEAAIEDTKKRERAKFAVESHRVHLHLHGRSEWASLREAAEMLWISEEEFFWLIDVGVMRVERGCVHLFVRVSGHPPDAWERTWASADGWGPFKIVFPGGFAVT